MKQVLFATTALIATAGMASAEITLSGSAQMGVFGGDFVRSADIRDEFDNIIANPDGVADDVQFFTDIDVTFTLSGETETGLVFGANIDLDESDGNPSGAFAGGDQGGEALFVSGSLGTLTMGDTDGALDFALTEAVIGGTLGDVHTIHAGYNGNSGLDGVGTDGQVARYQYTFGDFTVAASAEVDDRGTDADGEFDGDNIYGVGATYTRDFGTITTTFGFGYQTKDDARLLGASVDMAAGGFRVIANYVDHNDNPSGQESNFGIAVGYDFAQFTVGVNYGENEFDVGTADGYGIAVNYDLGGAELQLGYGDGEDQFGDDADGYSFGISMAF